MGKSRVLDSRRVSQVRRSPASFHAPWAWLGRCLAATLLVLFGSSQALPGLHHALVRHTVCAEHGELTHARHDSHPAQAEVEADSAAITAPDEEGGHGHGHCSFAALGAEPCPQLPPAPLERGATAGFATTPPRSEDRAHAALPLLSLAPKLAPPA